MPILSLNWLGRQCPTTRWLSGITSDGVQPGKMSRYDFPIGARRPPPITNRWLSRWFKHHKTSGHAQRVGLSQRFTFKVCHLEPSTLVWLVVAGLGLVSFAPPSQAQARKEVLIITEQGLSHPGMALVTNQIHSALNLDQRFQEELYAENLDAADLSEDLLKERRDSVLQEYRHKRLDVIVLVGPDPIRIFGGPSKTIYSDVPIVFCCAVPGQVDQQNIDSQFTGSWFQLDPTKTLDAALHLLPETRQLFVIAGQSIYDRGVTASATGGKRGSGPPQYGRARILVGRTIRSSFGTWQGNSNRSLGPSETEIRAGCGMNCSEWGGIPQTPYHRGVRSREQRGSVLLGLKHGLIAVSLEPRQRLLAY